MSWLSSFLHNPIDYISENPLKALGLLAAPLGLAAAPFLAPEIGAIGGGIGEALGFGGAAEGTALGLAPEVGGNSLQGLLEGAGGPFESFASGAPGGGAPSTLSSLVQAPELVPGSSAHFTDTFSQLNSGAFSEGLPGGSGFGGEAAPIGGTTPMQAAAEGATGPGINAGGAEAGGSFWDKIVGGAKDSIMKNPIGVGLAGAGLGYNMLTGSRQSPEMKALSGQAGQLNQQQAQLMSYLQKGTLPPGLQQGVQNATAAMKATIISNHARNGMNTDPSQNSALAQELGNVDRYAIELIAKEGVALMNSGLQAAGISSNLYAMLEKIHMQQAQSTGQAIANFAAALSGGPKINVIGNSGMGFAA